MSEALQSPGNSLTNPQYSNNAYNVRARFEYYNQHDLTKSIINNLKLRGDESVLDVGCADGKDLYRLGTEFGHRGLLIGADLFVISDDYPFYEPDEQLGSNKVRYICASAEDLPMPDDSMDVIMSLFVLYHVNDPQKALTEMSRVLKPGGQAVIATSGKGNKIRHRKFETQITEQMGLEPIPVFSSKFDADTALEELPKHFTNIKPFYYKEPRRFTLKDYQIYIDSINTMKDSFDPIPDSRTWRRTVAEIVEPIVRKEIAETGAFEDTIDRCYFICDNSN